MKNNNIYIIPFLGKTNKELNSSLLLISLAIGASIGYYFVKKYAVNKLAKNSGSVLNDIRREVENSTANLLGNPKDRNDPTKINVPEAGTLNWRKNRDKSIFPPIPDPNIRIN